MAALQIIFILHIEQDFFTIFKIFAALYPHDGRFVKNQLNYSYSAQKAKHVTIEQLTSANRGKKYARASRKNRGTPLVGCIGMCTLSAHFKSPPMRYCLWFFVQKFHPTIVYSVGLFLSDKVVFPATLKFIWHTLRTLRSILRIHRKGKKCVPLFSLRAGIFEVD